MNFRKFYFITENTEYGADKVKYNGETLLPISPYATAFGVLYTIKNPVFSGLDNLNGKVYISGKSMYHADLIQSVIQDIKNNKKGSISFEKDGKSYSFDAKDKTFNVSTIVKLIPSEYHRVKIFSPCGRFWNNPTDKFGGPYYIFSFWNTLIDESGNSKWEIYEKLLNSYNITKDKWDLIKFKFIDYDDFLSMEELQKELNASIKPEKSKEAIQKYIQKQSMQHLIGGMGSVKSKIRKRV